MIRNATLNRWMLATTTIAALSLTLAPLAQAYPGGRHGEHRGHARWGRPWGVTVVHEHRGGAGPALAGLIGGFVLGAAMAQSHPVVVHERVYSSGPVYRGNECRRDDGYRDEARTVVRYRYEDPNSDRWWDTLDECRDPQYGSDLPRVINVVEISTGRCVRTMYWKHDHWISDDDGWDD